MPCRPSDPAWRLDPTSFLCPLRLVRRSLTIGTAHALVRALIHSRLDYCNGVYAGVPAGLFNRLQSVLLASARLVLGLPGRAPVMSAIRDKLHWLSYPQRVTFKLCLTTYKCLHGLAPHYHRDLDFLRHINTLTYLLTSPGSAHRSPLSPVAHTCVLPINTNCSSPARLHRRLVHGRFPHRARCPGMLFPHQHLQTILENSSFQQQF